MKVLKRDAATGTLTVRPDSLDDLWHLSHLIDAGDVVLGTAYREPEEARAAAGAKVEKRAMTLGVRVESVEFHESTTRLRVMGPIVEGQQDVGMYHTLNVEPFQEVAIRKPEGRWREHHEERLRQAIEASQRPLVTFLAIEENEAVVAVLRQFGVTRAAEIVGHTSGKRYASATKGDEEAFFDEVLMALRDYRPEGAPLVVLGPGFAKERFLKHAKARQAPHAAGAVVEPTGQAGMTGVHEAVKRGVVDRVQKGNRVAFETQLVEKLFEAIATSAPCAFGLDHVRRALEAGAVESLLVSDDLLRGEGDRLLEAAQATGASAHVVSTRHEAGARLRSIGGAGALLRYAL